MKRVRIALAVATFALVGVVVRQVGENEPSYQGAELSAWLARYLRHVSGLPQDLNPDPLEPQAEEAVHHIGTKGIPTMLRLVDSSYRKPVKERAAELAGKIGFSKVVPHGWIRENPYYEYELGRAGLWLLGRDAKDAIPGLLELWHRRYSTAGGGNLIRDLFTYIDSSAREAALPAILRETVSRDTYARRRAAMDLGVLRVEPTVVVPELVKLMRDPAAEVRSAAAAAVSEFSHRTSTVTTLGPNNLVLGYGSADANPAVPALRELLNDKDPRVQQSARSALSRIQSYAGMLPANLSEGSQ